MMRAPRRSAGGAVADGLGTVDAVPAARRVGRDAGDRVSQFLVALDTVVLKYPAVPRPDADRLMEVLEREPVGVPEPVLGLRVPLADEVVRRVAVVADGGRVVAGL